MPCSTVSVIMYQRLNRLSGFHEIWCRASGSFVKIDIVAGILCLWALVNFYLYFPYEIDLGEIRYKRPARGHSATELRGTS